ncbi:MAG: AAA family ATPase [Cypionkella sp.]|nr:AAA family ATPase [Cypionkella sp.]
MSVKLYPDQQDLTNRVRLAMPAHKWVLMQSATGSGKTRMALDMIAGAVAKGSRTIFAVPRKELLAQTIETIAEYGLPFGVISPDYAPNPLAPIQLAMTPTLARRLNRIAPPKVIFIDECHFGGAEMESVIGWAKDAVAYGVGLSATPMKTNGKSMGNWYAHMECGLPVADLMTAGRLSQYRYYGPSAPDLSRVATRDGEYVASQLAGFMEAETAIIGDAVRTYRDTAAGKLCVVFATSRKHAGLIKDAFDRAGIHAQTIDGTMDTATRKRIVMGFARREYTVLINVALLTFGFDLAQAAGMDVRIEALSDMCPRKSLPLQMQVWGRALRAGPVPSIMLDHSNNWREHGFPDSPRQWSLAPSKAKRSGGERTDPVRQCSISDGGCGFVHRPAPLCPNCGFVYPVQSRIVDEVDGELQEIDRDAAERTRMAARKEQGRADSLRSVARLGKTRWKKPALGRSCLECQTSKGTGKVMNLSPQQSQAAQAVQAWLRDPQGKQWFYLAGYAGSGKTTIARDLAEAYGRVVFAAFTGKAVLVLAGKGYEPSSTIHSLIYKIKDPESPVPEFVLNDDSDVTRADLVVIDEVSMVGEDLARDLLSFGRKVLVLGDPAQLPPVGGDGFFTSRKPDFMLTEIHRQAAESPIIRMSMDIREGRGIVAGAYGSSIVVSRRDMHPDAVTAADQVIVGLNKTRRSYNARMREIMGYGGRFVVGERVVTLKNNKENGVLNGALWTVREIRDARADTSRLMMFPLDAGMKQLPVEVLTHHAWLDGKETDMDWRAKKHYDPVDYGYVLSCHKAQGSQWDNVLVFDESAYFRDDHKAWLYTAVTRAAERVTVVI